MSRYFTGAAFISLVIGISVFFGSVFNDITATDPYYKTSCTVIDLKLIPSICCDIVDCSCIESPATLPTCESIRYNNQCRNGYLCCSSGCDTCSGMRSFPCGKSTCYARTTYQCNCGCRASVSNSLCRTDCGTCTSIDITYSYDTSNVSSIEKCGKDDQKCVDYWVNNRQLNSTLECWIRDNEVYFSPKTKYYNKVAFAFSIVFFAISIIILVVFEGQLCYKRYRDSASTV